MLARVVGACVRMDGHTVGRQLLVVVQLCSVYLFSFRVKGRLKTNWVLQTQGEMVLANLILSAV
jgi:hypothetical protein